MTEYYYENREADLTKRIGNANTMKEMCLKVGKLLDAKKYEREEARLQQERLELLEQKENDKDLVCLENTKDTTVTNG